jgi:agmatine/peptidylarginine deiminase
MMCAVQDSPTAVPVADDRMTPASDGHAMPAEWDRHAACLMAWPTQRELWQDRFDDARRDYAAVAQAVADHEPVLIGPHCITQQIPVGNAAPAAPH